MSARDRLFSKIAGAVSDSPLREGRSVLKARMAEHRINLMPARADTSEPERLDLFLQKCAELAITVERLNDVGEVPQAVGTFLKEHNLPQRLRVSPDASVSGLNWSDTPLIETQTGAAEIADQVSLTPAYAAIAETGTLAMASSAETPASLNFVPDNHIVMLRRSQIVRAMEDAFALLRSEMGEGSMPRTLNLISGPSRTGDVEQKIVMGAHGPRRLHILLVDDVE